MRLQDMYTHYSSMHISLRRQFVDDMREQRKKECIAISESRKKPAKEKSTEKKEAQIKLTPEEETLCKLLGLSKKQLVELRKNHVASQS